jgi:hypothetical protein
VKTRQLVLVLVALPLGFVLGLATGFLQAISVDFFGLDLPIGIVLAVGLLIFCLRAINLVMGSRYGGLVMGFGWLIATVAGSFKTTAGDVVLQADTQTFIYLVVAGLLGAATLTWPVKKAAQTKRS